MQPELRLHGALAPIPDHRRDSLRIKEVVGVEEEHDVAAAGRKALVERGGVAAVGGLQARHDSGAVRADHRGGPVARIVVDDDHFHLRSEEHTSELQSLMRISYAVFCFKKKKTSQYN